MDTERERERERIVESKEKWIRRQRGREGERERGREGERDREGVREGVRERGGSWRERVRE